MSNSEEKFLQTLLSNGHYAGEDKLRKLYASIPDKKLVDQIVDTYGHSTPHPVIQPNVASYAYSAHATLEVEMFFGGAVTLHVSGYNKHFYGVGGGVMIVVSFTGGTLYYNDINDLDGQSNFNLNCVSVYTNLNLIRNGSVYATYSGGGMPAIGLSGGSGNWLPGS